MNDAKPVKLVVTDQQKNGPNWRSVTTASGKAYWFRFKGGNKSEDNGDQDLKVGTVSHFLVVLSKGTKNRGFRLQEFYCLGDHHSQLSCIITDGSTSAMVTDQCTCVCDGVIYGFWVVPQGGLDPFQCHPRINNQQ